MDPNSVEGFLEFGVSQVINNVNSCSFKVIQTREALSTRDREYPNLSTNRIVSPNKTLI